MLKNVLRNANTPDADRVEQILAAVLVVRKALSEVATVGRNGGRIWCSLFGWARLGSAIRALGIHTWHEESALWPRKGDENDWPVKGCSHTGEIKL